MIAWLLAIATAWGAATGPVGDLAARAADADLPETDRMAAFEALTEAFGHDPEALVALARDDGADARQRWVAIRALGQTGSPAARAPLRELARDPMPAIRAGAARALGDLGDPADVPLLTSLLRDPALLVRGAAADALGAVGDPRALPELAAALADPTGFYRGQSGWIRRHEVEAIAAIGTEAAIPYLVDALDDRDPTVVDAALAGLRSVVGYDFAEGRTREQHLEAWRRWWAARSESGRR